MTITSFEELLAPTPVDAFLRDTKGRKWLHSQAPAERVEGLFAWPELSQLLNMEVWNHQNLLLVQDTQPVPPQAYCRQRVDRSGQRQFVPDPVQVQQHLARGASLVLNEIETLVPGILRIINAFTEGLGAKSSANAYISQQNHQAFDTHYDKTDVFALQVYGQKRWRVYEGQMEAPVIHARFAGMPKELVQRHRGKVQREFVMNTGDLLYLPRGRFHDALATDGPSIHLSFAVSEPKGLDYLQMVMDEAVGDAAFRADLPLAEADLAAHFDMLADRLRAVARAQATKDRGKALRKAFVSPRADFDISPSKK
jgi:bifunctional lysine-specific demethylase and histidyl-hydroxylase MINA